jgi:hypothetical protein
VRVCQFRHGRPQLAREAIPRDAAAGAAHHLLGQADHLGDPGDERVAGRGNALQRREPGRIVVQREAFGLADRLGPGRPAASAAAVAAKEGS